MNHVNGRRRSSLPAAATAVYHSYLLFVLFHASISFVSTHSVTSTVTHSTISPKNAMPRRLHHRPTSGGPPKTSPQLLSLFLKTIIMTLITSLFFLSLGVAAIFLLHLFLVGSVLHRRRRQTRLPDSSNGLLREAVEKLPLFRYGKGTGTSECAICLEKFKEGQCCRELGGCSHVFHRNCVDVWLVKMAACPICRSNVRSNAQTTGSAAVSEEYKPLWDVGGNNCLQD